MDRVRKRRDGIREGGEEVDACSRVGGGGVNQESMEWRGGRRSKREGGDGSMVMESVSGGKKIGDGEVGDGRFGGENSKARGMV